MDLFKLNVFVCFHCIAIGIALVSATTVSSDMENSTVDPNLISVEHTTNHLLIAPLPDHLLGSLSNETTTQTTLMTTPVLTTTVLTTPDPTKCSDARPCRNGGTCTNDTCPGGTCTNYTCACTPEYNGIFCELPLSCQADDCNTNNTKNCTVTPTGLQQEPFYTPDCKCLPFYKGDRCETYDHCLHYPCQNRGVCVLSSSNTKGYTCRCTEGDPIKDCLLNERNECENDPPQDVQWLITCIDKIDGYEVLCAPGYTGRGCRDRVDEGQFCNVSGPDACTDEGYCKAHCNAEVCNGTGNCNFTTKSYVTDGFVNKTTCVHKFANGFYDQECDTEDTLFDGFDSVFGVANDRGVLKDCSPFFDTICTRKFGDDDCDPKCNHADCLRDGGDCDAADGDMAKELSGGVVIEFKTGTTSMHVNKLSMMSRSLLNQSQSFSAPVPHIYLKATSSNFTHVENLGRFLSGVIAKLPHLIDNVTDVYVCEAGKYSNSYSDMCSLSCGHCNVSGDICDWKNGSCLYGCLDGYWGSRCDQRCPSVCIGGCSQKGFCSSCPLNKYGANCESTCDVHCVDKACGIEHGNCTCQTNRIWSTAKSRCTCEPSFFGDDCSSKCDNCHEHRCDDRNGHCLGPCVSGYYGLQCDKPCQPSGCKSCDKEKGTCNSDGGAAKKGSGARTDNTGVIIGVVVSILLVVAILLLACCYWRKRQSGDYIMDDEEGELTPTSKQYSVDTQPAGSSGMQPVSPHMGRTSDMIDMDEKKGSVVYAGPEKTPLLSPNGDDAGKKDKDGEPRQPADGDSEEEPEPHADTDADLKSGEGGRFASSVVIEVDKKGRVMSITDAAQVPSPSALKQDDEVFTVEISDLPPPDAEVSLETKSESPPHSPLSETRAPLASEEDLLSSLGPRPMSAAEEMKPKDLDEEKLSRKSSTSSSSSSASSHSKHSHKSEPEISTEKSEPEISTEKTTEM